MNTKHKNKLKLLTLLALCMMAFHLDIAAQAPPTRPSQMGNRSWRSKMNETNPDFFKTDEALRIGRQIILWQRDTGGWPKNIDMVTPMTDEQRAQTLADKQRTDDSTIDNGATTQQLKFLARLYQQTGDKPSRDAFRRGVEFLLSGQYEEGGWPQFWPNPQGYQVHITFNDDAICNTLEMFRDMIQLKEPYQGKLTDKKLRQHMQTAFDKGIECILATQIRVNGQPTIWCQQHDRVTLKPTKARAYELPSFTPQESASLVRLLMQLPHPDERVKQAVHGAMRWFDKYKLTGLRLVRTGWREGNPDTRLIDDPNAEPLWARFYDLDNCQPYVCDRDGVPRRRLEDIGPERRNGYAWYGNRPAELYPLYEQWADRFDPARKEHISLNTKGANENGTIQMYHYAKPAPTMFDAVVSPGESIQQAIERAPQNSDKPYTILLRKGQYHEKVIIDRPNIVLVGEQRDSTIILLAETAQTQAIREYHGKPVGNGVVVIQEGADDCIIYGLTIYNNYGTTVENTTTHQMAVFGRATRTIVINSNIWADGNDALSLWAQGGNGMYYHADLNLRCPGVDFLCPRGWCYATRCHFYGDGRAIIWHDGRGDQQKKLVITNSTFDAKRPTPLGRYHHDAQFFILNCRLSNQIIDANISYAYTDKVLDPCPWGQRTYYYNCTREGGHSGWLANNLQNAPDAPHFYDITAKWTFNGQWDPEKRIQDLWNVLAY